MINVNVLHHRDYGNLLLIEFGGCNHPKIPLAEILHSKFYADGIGHGYMRRQKDLLMTIPMTISKIVLNHYCKL